MRIMRWISLLAVAGALIISLPTAQAAPLQQQGVGQICVRALAMSTATALTRLPTRNYWPT
jgi:hypothetical protein